MIFDINKNFLINVLFLWVNYFFLVVKLFSHRNFAKQRSRESTYPRGFDMNL